MALESRRIATIDQLPPELLMPIFSQIDDRYDGHDWQDISYRKAWPVVLLVCKYWHDVACGIPSLWQDIHVHSNPDWLKVSLQRSGTALVDVTLRKRQGYPASIPILIDHADRIRMLAMLDSKRHGFRTVKPLLLTDLPNLQELRIAGEKYLLDRSYLRLKNRLGSWPALRALRLTHLYLTIDPAVFRNLRVLDLAHMEDGSRTSMPLDWALSVLETCSALEELRLNNVFPELVGDSQRVVPLPHLRRLEVFSKLPHNTRWPRTPTSPLVSSAILLHVHLPLHASLKFVSQVRPWTPIGYQSFIRLEDPACIPILRHATYACVRPNSFVCTEPGGGTLEGAVEFDTDETPRWFCQNSQLIDVFSLLAHAPLTHLALVSESLRDRSMSAAFDVLSALTTLEFSTLPTTTTATAAHDGAGAGDKRFLALLSTLTLPRKTWGAGGSPRDSESRATLGPLSLPSLRVLRLNGVLWESSVLSHLLGCLDRRLSMGAQNLTELFVAMYGRKPTHGAEGQDKDKDKDKEERENLKETLEMFGTLVDGPVVCEDCEPPRVS